MWDKAKSDAMKNTGSSTMKDMLNKEMQDIKVEKTKKDKNGLTNWSEAQSKPTLYVSNKHITNMPDMKPGDKVMMAMECTVKSCKLTDDNNAKDYNLEMEKMGFIE